jgi:xanthine dehydrogenase/oxidase
MPVENVFLKRAWKELLVSSQFEQKKKQVEEFNKLHKYRKRGVTMMPTKFGLAFTARHLNQAAALVHVYADGSVKIAHGGTEMGQGLHTKMLQVAADAFGIPMNMIHLSETRTDTVINTSATAASVSSDLNGKAIWDACQQINARLDVIKKRLGDSAQWTEVIKTAYFERINLSANGFYATPDLDFDWKSNTGRMFSYFTYGVACTMVEIDTLSGDHVILSSDIIMDIGRPINPLIDIGQIEGGFTQGLGWCTIEEPLINKSGFLLTRGPGLYKIPGFKDIPVEFNVTVMDQVQNDKAIHSSKAVGEPPLFLGASCFFAIREAIQAARVEYGLSREHFRLDSPVTSERLRMACMDEFTARSRTPLLPGERAWGFPS